MGVCPICTNVNDASADAVEVTTSDGAEASSDADLAPMSDAEAGPR